MKDKINKYYMIFILITLVMFLGAMNSILTYISVIAATILATIIGRYCIKNPNEEVCVGIISLLVFQNLCIGIGAHIAGNTSNTLKFITQIPFLTIAVIWIINQFNYFKDGKYTMDKSKKSFLALLICILFSLVLGRGSIQSILINIRNLTVFYMAFEIGRYNLPNKESFNKFVRQFLKIAIVVFVLGIILLIFGYEVYKLIGIHEVYIAKGAKFTYEKLPGRFRTTLIKQQYTRMGSIYYEPVNLAYFFAAALLVSIFCDWTKSKKNKIITILIMGIGLMLTFGKGGYLLVGTVFLCLALQKLLEKVLKNMNSKKIYIITLCVIFSFVCGFCIFYYKNIGAAVSPHFWGVIRTWESVVKKPYGYGLGTGGNMAQVFNENPGVWLETGGETALMSYMYQIGLQGIVALIICMYNISTTKQNKEKNYLYKAFSFIPLVLLGVSLLQDNTFSPQCIVPFMLLQGGLKACEQKIYDEEEEEIT